MKSLPAVIPPPKTFKPKHPLPTLDSYKEDAPDWFWIDFPSNLRQPAPPIVNADRLEELALETDFPDKVLLARIVKDVREGAKIGCKEEFRVPSSATNAPSAFKDGAKVTDALADWVSKGFAYGPLDPSEVPASAKFSGIMTKAKPNGSVRVIVNLSGNASEVPVNKGIDKADFPTKFSTLKDWLRAMKKAGPHCRFCKVDWSDAYKHVTVHLNDTELQWFMWLGKAFKELCLIFGCVSSAGLFDRLAKLVLHIVISRSGLDRDLVIQYLDDCCAAAPHDSLVLDRFDAEFTAVAHELGITLAPRDNPEKSFGPSTQGIVLGIHYDSVSWTWGIPQERLMRLLKNIDDLLACEKAKQGDIWTVVGKIMNILFLIPTGKFNVDHLLRANSVSEERDFLVDISSNLKRQLTFWRQMLPVCSGATAIPDPDDFIPAWAVDVYSDAAGGSSTKIGHGVGAVMPGWWAFIPWGKAINFGRDTNDGTDRHLDRVMSAWELAGPVLVLAAGMEQLRGAAVRIWVDNIGSVCIWDKGYCPKCRLCCTMVKALSALASTFGCRVEVTKITRCSTPLAVMADCLSKAAFSKFWRTAYENGGFDLPLEPAWVPSELVAWLEDPKEDDDLGERIVRQVLLRSSSWIPPASL